MLKTLRYPPASAIAATLRQDAAPYEVHPAQADEVRAAHALAAQLIGGRVASVADLGRVHARTGAGVFVAREDGEIAGVLAFVLLNLAGHEAVLEGSFDAVAPAVEHIAGQGEPVSALYGWGVAAASKPAAKRVLDASGAMGRNGLAHLPYYARPTTPAGQRLMRERLGFVDVPGSKDGLVWAPPFAAREAAA